VYNEELDITMGKVTRIIEHQDDVQRSPEEALAWVGGKVADISHMIIIFREDGKLAYMPASKDREYSKPEALWDIVQLLSWWIKG